MDVSKTIPLDATAGLTGAPPATSAGAGSTSAAASAAVGAANSALTADSRPPGSAALGNAAGLADRLDIQTLDLQGAVRILIAEVRSELELPADASMAGASSMTADASMAPNAARAPQALMQIFLQVLPEETQEPDAWMIAVTRAEAALLAALDRGVEAISGWRDVSPAMVQGAQEIRSLVVAALRDDPPNPLWLRPEWLGLAPQVERLRRRRRLARRGLSDPDLRRHDLDEDAEKTAAEER